MRLSQIQGGTVKKSALYVVKLEKKVRVWDFIKGLELEKFRGVNLKKKHPVYEIGSRKTHFSEIK